MGKKSPNLGISQGRGSKSFEMLFKPEASRLIG